jgi:hypothetical protein
LSAGRDLQLKDERSLHDHSFLGGILQRWGCIELRSRR